MNDRELDALIAEKVMGLAVACMYESYTHNCVVNDIEYARFERDHPYNEPPRLLPHYSSDLNDTMLIVETLHNEGYIVTIYVGIDEVEVSVWNNDLTCIAKVTTDNIIESICHAALDWKNVDTSM